MEFGESSYGGFASQFLYPAKSVKKYIESTRNPEIFLPPHTAIKGMERLLEMALEAVDGVSPAGDKHATAYVLVSDAIKKQSSVRNSIPRITSRIKSLQKILGKPDISQISEHDAQTLIGICNEIIDFGSEYRNA